VARACEELLQVVADFDLHAGDLLNNMLRCPFGYAGNGIFVAAARLRRVSC
jgi:hypothetical protein